uniref:Uncharacterized protein n=1 Tax=Acrobeloides nanus TaxID=290746 RepID=A0A914E5X0_9BILA
MNEDIKLHQEATIMIDLIAIGLHRGIATTIDQITIAEEKIIAEKTETTKEVVTIAETTNMYEILIITETTTVTEVTQETVTTQQITDIGSILTAII